MQATQLVYVLLFKNLLHLLFIIHFHKSPHTPRLLPDRSGVLPPTGLSPTPAPPVSADATFIIGSVSSPTRFIAGISYLFFIIPKSPEKLFLTINNIETFAWTFNHTTLKVINSFYLTALTFQLINTGCLAIVKTHTHCFLSSLG